MDSLRTHATTDTTRGKVNDLSSLAWVHDELRRSLEAAHKALRRFVKESEAFSGSDVDAVDPAVLRSARQQIHQGVGALELVGLPEVATVLRASEAAVQRFIAKPGKLSAASVETLERASFALLDYVQRVLAGREISPLALFPQYHAVQELAGAERVHPADLWTVDWRWLELPPQDGVTPLAADAEAIGAFEQQLLALMRSNGLAASARLSELCAGLGAGAATLPGATLWRLAAGFFEGQAQGLIKPDVYGRRVASRLLAQLRAFVRGDVDVSERLAQDLLFFCAQSATPSQVLSSPRLDAVRHVYGLGGETPVDYAVSQLGKYDPAWIAQARKRVAAARDAWSSVAGGELHRLNGLPEQFALVGDSLKRLYPHGEHLADELQYAVVGTQQSGTAPAPGLAMEVATSVLYLEASLEDADFDHADQGARVRRLAERIGLVREGRTAPPLEAWMEELYRRVSDRQTMGSVVQELHASLAETEKQIDQFFRNPADPQVLVPVPNQLAAMRGVLSVLGLDAASQAVLRMRDDVDQLLVGPADPVDEAQRRDTFDRLAGNVSALSFLINMLSVQPQAKSLFAFDARTGRLNPVMGRAEPPAAAEALPAVEPRVMEEAVSLALSAGSPDVPVTHLTRELERLSHDALIVEQPALHAAVEQAHAALEQALDAGDEEELATVRGQLTEAISDFVATATDPVGLDLAAEPEAPLPAIAPLTLQPAPQDTDLGDDAEMREIFLEEAREVIATGEDAREQLRRAPDDVTQLTSLRRAFHTLKGSARMVGLKEFGEAGWAGEQVFNTWLAAQKPADPVLLDFSAETLGYMKEWVESIASGQGSAYTADPVRLAAASLEAGMPWPPIGLDAVAVEPMLPTGELDLDTPEPSLPEAAPAPIEVAPTFDLSAPPDEPMSAFDDLPAVPVIDAPEWQQPEPATASSAEALDFNLDLGALEEDSGTQPPSASPTEAIPLDLPSFEASQLPDIAGDADARTFDDKAPAAEVVDPDLGRLSGEVSSGSPLVDLPIELPADDAAPVIEVITPEPLAPQPAEPQRADEPAAVAETPVNYPEDDQVKVVGPLRIGIPLFNIYLNEADELSRRLTTEVAEWAMELHRPVGEMPIALAHSLAGSSATVGFNDLSQLARSVEHALMRQQAIGQGEAEDGRLFVDAAEEIRRLLHQFAAGFLKTPSPELLVRLADHEVDAARRLETLNRTTGSPALGLTDDEPDASVVAHLDAAVDDVVDPTMQAAPADVDAEPLATDEAQPPLEGADQPLDTAALSADMGPELEPHAASEPPSGVAAPEPAAVDAPIAGLPVPLADTELGSFDPGEALLGQAELKAFTPLPAAEIRAVPIRADALDTEEDIDAVDAVDAELFPIFEEEAQDLLPQLSSRLRDWAARPTDASLPAACMRTLHTLKGGARLAGAMRLGEMAHRLESAIEHLTAQETVQAHDVDALQARADSLQSAFERLRSQDAQAYAEAEAAVVQVLADADPAPELAPLQPLAVSGLPEASDSSAAPLDGWGAASDSTAPFGAEPLQPAGLESSPAATPARKADTATLPIDWSRFAASSSRPEAERTAGPVASQATVRVRGALLERLVNQAGEVSITRSRIEAEIGNLRNSLGDLTDNLERLRQQLRDIEFQADLQMSSRIEAAKAAEQEFDPLESDRFTRFQELTRMMAESVNDVATVQRSLQRTLETAEDELAEQGRLTRDLQGDLLRTRMVEFEGQADRLYRVVRQAAKETGKQVRLDIVGGSIEVDRGVLDRMTPAFEHLLRNCVTHGIERPEARVQAGKDPTGAIVVAVTQDGNEVGVEFRDDGAGLDLDRIREKGRAMGLLPHGDASSDAELANLIFAPGFSTAESITELAGRGVGMDVVRSEVNAMGGRIETATARGQGTGFKLVLPLTTAVTQVVMLRCGDTVLAVPSTLIEIVRRARADELDRAYETGTYPLGDRPLLFFWLGALLQLPPSRQDAGRMRSVVIVRSAQQRVALHVDEVLGNQEVVVKNLGPQLSRLPGLAGMTLLASGAVALIYNPVALATLYGDSARAAMLAARQAPEPAQPLASAEPAAALAPLVLVVDDSLTVRRVTQRLLVREGYRVELAKDGMDALERLAETRPAVVLSDIEMPRMDGFDLVRNIRGDARLRDLPVIMITSRIAQKHRDHAAELGVDHYLGKPYSEEDLLALIGRYTDVSHVETAA